MDILDRIVALLNTRNQKELCDYLKLDKSAVTSWKNGSSKSYRKYLIEIAEFFNVSIDYLVYGKEKGTDLNTVETRLLTAFKKLPTDEQMIEIGRVEHMAEICSERTSAESVPMIELRHSYYKVSAGTGYDLDDGDQWNTIEIPDTPEARKADYCLTISGNSMEPVYYDGDIVLVKSQPLVNRGEIGIFVIENAGYIKKFGGDRLISLNAEYDDILFSDYDPDEIHCSGLVIGRV